MFVLMISSTLDWMSLSVMRLMWPLRTFLSQICSGLLPIEYRIERKPDWNVLRNMVSGAAAAAAALSLLCCSRARNAKTRKTSQKRTWCVPMLWPVYSHTSRDGLAELKIQRG